jgi:hypothetical protein
LYGPVKRTLASLLLFAAAFAAHGGRFLDGYDEAPTLARAFEQVRAQPQKHVLLYFDMSQHCPACAQVRSILNRDAVRMHWRRNYVVVSVDLYQPGKEEREIIEQLRVSWAPVLVFLDPNGRRVTYARELRNDTDARLLDEFVSQRQYATSAVARYGGQRFDAATARYAAQQRVLKEPQASRTAADEAPIEDQPRLKQVLANKPERLSVAQLRQALAGKVMHKENQDWFLDLALDTNGSMQASGRRKAGEGTMRGTGK